MCILHFTEVAPSIISMWTFLFSLAFCLEFMQNLYILGFKCKRICQKYIGYACINEDMNQDWTLGNANSKDRSKNSMFMFQTNLLMFYLYIKKHDNSSHIR